MLERAAVIGRSFSLDAVLQLIPADEREPAQARVFELVRRGLIRAGHLRPGGRLPLPARAHPRGRLRVDAEGAAGGSPRDGRGTARRRRRRSPPSSGSTSSTPGCCAGSSASGTPISPSAPGASCASRPRRRSAGPTRRRRSRCSSGRAPPPRRRSGAAGRADRPRRRAAERRRPARSGVRARRGGGGRRRARPAAPELHARIELQFVRAFAESTPVEESVELAKEAIAELEPLGDELALARAWWLRSSGDPAACRWRARGVAIERALSHARARGPGSRWSARWPGCSPRRSCTARLRSTKPSPASGTLRDGARARRAAAGIDRHEPGRAARDARRLRRGAAPVSGRGRDE